MAVMVVAGKVIQGWRAVMHRIRIIFEKRGWFTFVNHMDLPNIFARAARRAGLKPEYTQGFSPHPHMSLGPALAISVEGLEEPAEFWFEDWSEGSAELWSAQLPEGLAILKWGELPEGTGLAKFATAAQYNIQLVNGKMPENAKPLLEEAVKKIAPLWFSKEEDGVITLIVGELNRCGASLFVKTLQEAGIIDSWGGLYMVRNRVGSWDEAAQTMLPLL